MLCAFSWVRLYGRLFDGELMVFERIVKQSFELAFTIWDAPVAFDHWKLPFVRCSRNACGGLDSGSDFCNNSCSKQWLVERGPANRRIRVEV